MFFATPKFLSLKNKSNNIAFESYVDRLSINIDSVKFFLQNKSDPNNESNKMKSPFYSLFDNNRIKKEEILPYIELFFSFNANPNFKNLSNETPFHLYCESEYLEMNGLKLFFENKANPNSKNKALNTPFLCACNNSNLTLEMINLFISNKSDVTVTNKNSSTCLHSYCSYGEKTNVEILRILIDNGADLNAKNDRLKTAFEIYLKMGHADVQLYQLFIDRGFDLNSVKSPPLLAIAKQHRKKDDIFNLAVLLIANKANVYSTDKKDRPLLEVTKNISLIKAVNLFMENGTVWSLDTHRFFPPSFRTMAVHFFLAIREFSKRKSFLFPKPIILMIIKFASVTTFPRQEKRKQENSEKKESKRRKN